jgi:hypothetical protein
MIVCALLWLQTHSYNRNDRRDERLQSRKSRVIGAIYELSATVVPEFVGIVTAPSSGDCLRYVDGVNGARERHTAIRQAPPSTPPTRRARWQDEVMNGSSTRLIALLSMLRPAAGTPGTPHHPSRATRSQRGMSASPTAGNQDRVPRVDRVASCWGWRRARRRISARQGGPGGLIFGLIRLRSPAFIGVQINELTQISDVNGIWRTIIPTPENRKVAVRRHPWHNPARDEQPF